MERAAHWNHVYTTKAEGDVSWFEAPPGALTRRVRLRVTTWRGWNPLLRTEALWRRRSGNAQVVQWRALGLAPFLQEGAREFLNTGKLVSRIFASWNQLDGWLRQVDRLWRAGR